MRKETTQHNIHVLRLFHPVLSNLVLHAHTPLFLSPHFAQHPVFQEVSPLGRGILKKRNNRETIHVNGEYGNIYLLYRTVHAANQLCIWGAASKWCGSNSGDASQTQTWKRSQDVPRNSNKTERSQAIGGYSKTTACIVTPNSSEFEGFQFDTIYEQN